MFLQVEALRLGKMVGHNDLANSIEQDMVKSGITFEVSAVRSVAASSLELSDKILLTFHYNKVVSLHKSPTSTHFQRQDRSSLTPWSFHTSLIL